jgi:hypothetical protein
LVATLPYSSGQESIHTVFAQQLAEIEQLCRVARPTVFKLFVGCAGMTRMDSIHADFRVSQGQLIY